MKKMISILLTLCILIGLFAVGASAAETSGTCGENLTWNFADGTLTISGTGSMKSYIANQKKPWDGLKEEILKIVVEEGVNELSEEAFWGCVNLVSVSLPRSISEIPDNLFRDCGSLTGISIPDSVTSIGGGAFWGCGSLTALDIPDGVTTIGGHAFAQCSGLKEIIIPDGVALIDIGLFGMCSGLTSVTLGKGITKIDASAFMGCGSLTSVMIPASVTQLGEGLFQGCESLQKIYFTGDAPAANGFSPFGDGSEFNPNVTVTAYYPKNNATWTEETMASYGGDITWIAYDMVNFTDVLPDAYYAESVLWAVENNITQGTTPTTFSPNGDCTRAQVVTFLWRAAGEPKPETTVNPFSDVKSGDYYYNAVLWAVEKEITVGMGDGKFGVNEICTREQVATFLYRAAGKPEFTAGNNPFSDVKSTNYSYQPILWAVSNGITQGTGTNTFSPTANCSRAQIVTFLYRFKN